MACSVELGTLSKCDGLCPIDYYIKNLMLEVTDFSKYLVGAHVLLLVGIVLISG